MGRKNSANLSESEPQSEPQIQEQVQNKIKNLPTLKEKVQAIAINSFLIQKRLLDTQLGKQIGKIELDFRKRFQPFIDQINNIVSGTHTYTDDDFKGDQILNQEQNTLRANYYKNQEFSQYWFKALVQSDVVGESVKQIDDALLKKVKQISAVKDNQDNLKVVFTFAENEWFTNTTLTKQFELDGDTIKRSFGDEINWKQGKNITIKVIKKKGKKGKKTTTKQVQVQSFFNFFKQIDLSSDDEQGAEQQVQQQGQDQTEVQKLERQYEIANQIYESILPRSLQFFLGVVGGDLGDFGQGQGLQAIGQDDDQEDEDEKPKQTKKNKTKKKSRKGSQASEKSK